MSPEAKSVSSHLSEGRGPVVVLREGAAAGPAAEARHGQARVRRVRVRGRSVDGRRETLTVAALQTSRHARGDSFPMWLFSSLVCHMSTMDDLLVRSLVKILSFSTYTVRNVQYDVLHVIVSGKKHALCILG